MKERKSRWQAWWFFFRRGLWYSPDDALALYDLMYRSKLEDELENDIEISRASAYSRMLSNDEVLILAQWNRLSDEKPKHNDVCGVALITSEYSDTTEQRCRWDEVGQRFMNEYNMVLAYDPQHTYWKAS